MSCCGARSPPRDQQKVPIYPVNPDPDIEEKDCVVIGGEVVMNILTVGLWSLTGLYIVGPRECRLILHNGRLTHVEAKPGLHWSPAFGRYDKGASTADCTYIVPEIKVVDTTGVPMIVSAVLVYKLVDCKKALLDIDDVHQYIRAQASAALKLIVSRYSYEELKVEATQVQTQVVEVLQDKSMVCGAEIKSMTLNELNYAPEIASAMLKKQQAAALVSARELIVEGACNICRDAVAKLEENGMQLEQADKVKIVTNLLTVVCGEENATPVINV